MTAFCKRVYAEFLYVPKHSKAPLREKVMITRIALSVLLMVLCMSAMTLSAYAFFTHSLYSEVTTVQTASWRIEVDAPQGLTAAPEGVYTLVNESDDTAVYAFTLRRAADATATLGYAQIVVTTDVGAPQEFYTQPMGRFLQEDAMTEDNDREVRIAVPAGRQATVQFVGQWGTCTRQPIVDESQPVAPLFATAVTESATTTTTTTTTATTTEVTAVETTTTTQTTTTAPIAPTTTVTDMVEEPTTPDEL